LDISITFTAPDQFAFKGTEGNVTGFMAPGELAQALREIFTTGGADDEGVAVILESGEHVFELQDDEHGGWEMKLEAMSSDDAEDDDDEDTDTEPAAEGSEPETPPVS